MTHDYWEEQYNPRLTCPDAARRFDVWRAHSVAAREELGPVAQIAYGAHRRERLDLFRAGDARGTLVFLHGGYWRAFGREDFSWIAPPFVRAGITVAIPSYPLLPESSLTQAVAASRRALAHLRSDVLTPAEQRCLVVAGHSAGAHLAACQMAWPGDGGVADATVCVSGLFDLAPLERVRFLRDLALEPCEARALSPLFAPPPEHGNLLLAVGEAESREFRCQTLRLAGAWAARCSARLEIARADHFSVLEGLCACDSELTRAVASLFTRGA